VKWILNYIDVPVGDPLDKVEDRCFQGWEPFAITEWDFYEPGKPPRPMYKFWFKKKVKQ